MLLIRLQFPKSKSISGILHRKLGQSTLDYCPRRVELDLEFLLRCRDSSAIPNFWNFHVRCQSLKASLTYKQCQLKLLHEEICCKKSDIRDLKKEFNSSHSSLQHEISFIDFAHVSSVFLRSNSIILASKSATRQKS